jgi:hypothetical protein
LLNLKLMYGVAPNSKPCQLWFPNEKLGQVGDDGFLTKSLAWW